MGLIRAVIAVIILLNMIYVPAYAEAPLVEIYVSTGGSDSALGTEADPVSLKGARQLMYTARKAGNRVDVYVNEGTYVLNESLSFTEGYSGTLENPVRFVAKGEAVFTTAVSIPFEELELINDNDIRDRVKPEVRNKIYKVDLSEFGITAGAIPEYKGRLISGDEYDDMSVYTSSSELSVAQYPNGEGNYAKWIERKDKRSFTVEEKTASNWQNEDYAYYEGYPGYEYSCERNNITIADNLITFRYDPTSGVKEKSSDRYKIKHILYELDVPGEWYADRETNVLYIYPTEDVKENGISVAANKMPAITLRKANYLTFEGITFDRIRGNGVTGTYWCNNITFKNCTFSNITNYAIFIRADANTAVYGAYLKAFNFTTGGKNIVVDSNKFINIGAAAVEIYGGTRETLTPSGNVISNNYIYNASSKTKYNHNVIMRGCGGEIINNEIHGGAFHAINIGNNDGLIKGNEIYNMARETGDTGLIYTGKSFTVRGTEVAYNYIHDYGQHDRMLGDVITGIYFDERQSGMYVHHNILYPNAVNSDGNGIQNNGGQQNRFEYNIIIESANPFALSNRINATIVDMERAMRELMFTANIDETVTLDDGIVIEGITEPYSLYLEKYPELENTALTLKNPNETVKELAEKYPAVLSYKTLAEDIENGADLEAYRLLSVKLPAENTVIGNITNTSEDYSLEKSVYEDFGGTFGENTFGVSEDDFVDFENKDFRIKSTASCYVEGMLNESFDMSTIGIQTFAPERQKEFSLTYPENNSNVSDMSELFFMWEKPVGADKFTVEIADNINMENPVVYETCYNWLEVKGLDAKDTYYWRVTAENISKNPEKWQSGVPCFNKGYEIAVKDVLPMKLFDMTADFNVNMVLSQGEAFSSKPYMSKFCEAEIKNKIMGGYLDYRGVKYSFPNVTSEGMNSVYVPLCENESYTYYLKDSEKGCYDKINAVVTGYDPISNYEVKFNYSDGSSSTDTFELGKSDTIYYNTENADWIFWTNGVNSRGELSGEAYMFAVSAEADESKELIAIEFLGGEVSEAFKSKVSYTTSNSICIFAITGVFADEGTSIVYSCSSAEDKNVKLIVTGYRDDEFEAYVLDAKAESSSVYNILETNLPSEAEELTLKRCFIWSDLKTLKPLAEVSGLNLLKRR